MRDWAVWQAGASCYSQVALSSNDSKTLYSIEFYPNQVSVHCTPHNCSIGSAEVLRHFAQFGPVTCAVVGGGNSSDKTGCLWVNIFYATE